LAPLLNSPHGLMGAKIGFRVDCPLLGGSEVVTSGLPVTQALHSKLRKSSTQICCGS
jgi:hypothetical protein